MADMCKNCKYGVLGLTFSFKENFYCNKPDGNFNEANFGKNFCRYFEEREKDQGILDTRKYDKAMITYFKSHNDSLDGFEYKDEKFLITKI